MVFQMLLKRSSTIDYSFNEPWLSPFRNLIFIGELLGSTLGIWVILKAH